MADQKDINNQKKLNEELSATDKALLEAGRKAAQLTEESRTLTEELKEQLGIRSRNNEGEKTLLSLSRQITKSAQENKVALRESGDISKQLEKDEETLLAAKREQLILEQTIGKEGIDQAKAISSRAKAIQTGNANILNIENEIANQKGGATEEQLKLLAAQEKGLRLNEGGLASALKGASADAQRLALANGLVIAAGENIDEGVKQEAAQKRINKSLGIAGGLANAFKGAFGGLAGAIGMDQVADDMKKFATEAEDAKKSVSRLQVLGVGMVSAFKGLGTTLTDPSVILTSLIKGFNEVDKAATDFQQQTGQDLNTMSTSWDNFNLGLITTAEYMKAASDITKEFGVNAAAVFTPENLIEAASMTKEMGLAGKEAANLARLSKVNGGNIEAQNEAIISGINSANRQNKTAVAHGQVLRDVANVSDGIAISYAGYPDKLGEAAGAAAALGMKLGDIDKIAGSLLSFESSIAAEMEAELLTGIDLNLEKARELALNNDLAGVAKELANQGITSAKFSKMNRIQQEAQAKALGMSRDEMSRMLLQQEMTAGLSEGALNDAQKATLEDLKRVDAQEKFATAIAKLQQALAPIVGFFADIFSNSLVIYSVMGVALLAKMPMLVASARGLASGFGDAWKNAKGLAGGIGGLFKKGGIKDAASKIKSSFMPSTSKVDTSKVDDVGKKTKPGAGKGLKDNLKGLAAGLRSMGTGPVLKGVVNLAAFGVASIPTLASIPFLLFIGLTPLKQIKSNMQSLAAGLRSMGKGTLKGSLALGVFGIAAIPSIASIPFLLFMGLVPLGALTANFTALSTGLIAMSGTYSGIGALSLLALAGILMIPGSVGLAMFGGAAFIASAGIAVLTPALIALGTAMASGVGALGLAALVVAAVGLGAAFALVGIGALAMGKGIQLAAQGFAIMVPHILSLIPTIPALFILGGALISVGVGLSFMALAGLLAIPVVSLLALALPLVGVGALAMGEGIKLASEGFATMVPHILSLVSTIPALFLLGGALMSIGAGLGLIAVAGLAAIPALLALGAIGMIAGGLFGGSDEGNVEGEGGSTSMAGVEAKLDKLISIVEAGGDVYIDGSKVGKTLQLSTSRMG